MIIFNKSIQHIHITSGQIQSFAAVVPVQQTCTSFIGFFFSENSRKAAKFSSQTKQYLGHLRLKVYYISLHV